MKIEYFKKKCIYYLYRYQLFIRYCLIGVSGASLDFIVFTLLIKNSVIFYQYANILSVTIGITNNFFLNVFFNFKKYDKLLFRFACFYSVGILGLGLSACLLFLFIDKLNYNVYISKFFTIFFVTVFQYTLNKLVSFKTYKNKVEIQ